MRHAATFCLLCWFGLLWPVHADAVALRVAPVLLDVMAPSSATKLTLRNDNNQNLQVQLRVFRWIQDSSGDRLVPTTDVVVSPPMMTLTPETEYVARIVRVAPHPVRGEESYRVLVDELPDSAQRRNGTISIVVRQSIPVFFASPDVAPANVTWSIASNPNAYVVTVANNGSKRLRVASLKLASRQGTSLAQSPGLVGYILGGSQVRWSIPAHRSFPYPDVLKLTAETEAEPLDVTTKVVAPR
jgi:fimbrial chaperone protein